MANLPTPPTTALTACIITRDDAERISDCLDSVKWCDEIVVVDSHSTDDTRKRAMLSGARVIERDWPGYAAQKDFAVRAAQHDWVLCVDADERVSPSLQIEIQALRATGFPSHAGWAMPRRTWYLGTWIGHGTWYPDYSLRLFDRRRGRWVEHPHHQIHERVQLQGTLGRLREDLLHVPYRNLSDHLRSMDQYTTLMAEGLHRRGRRARLDHITVRPVAEFVRFYILRQGFRDGWRGLVLAYLHAHYVRLKFTKLLIMQRGGSSPGPSASDLPQP